MKLWRQLGLAALAVTTLSGPVLAADVVIGMRSEPSSIDPYFHNLGPNNAMLGQIFDRLTDWTPGMDKIIGRAAGSWKAINDTTWEYKLKKGIKFHDGSDLTADDVIFSYKRADSYEGGNSSFRTYTKGKTLKKIDDHTLHIITDSPYPLMPNDTTTVMIMSSDAKGTGEAGKNNGISAKDFNDGTATVGSGPYKFVEWKKGDRIVLEKFDGYQGPLDQPWDKITFKFIKAEPARVAALLAGDVDMIDNVPTSDIERLKSETKVSLSSGVSNRVIYLHMDQFRDNSPFVTTKDGKPMDKNPLKDARVRKAISMMINRDAIVARVMEGVAIPAGQLLPEGFFGRSPNLSAEKYNPKGAKKLLAEAGWGDGFGLTIHGPNDRYINDAKIAEAIGQMLSAQGIPTKVETMPKNVYFKRASKGAAGGLPEFSFFLVGWGSGTGEPSSPLKSLLATHDKDKGKGASNRGRHSDGKVDALLNQALATVEDTKRAALLAETTDLAIGVNQGIIPLHYQVNTWATRKGLKYIPRADERTTGIDLVPAN
ncbi:MAG: ABC transporter substrate-binding protein [Alphaproteobacteria bacterium]|jgi:peptide/nickel transport system substrate-binding protein|nr:ABC transporter substrate-binding protein [Alphaproteobacteria bacterium]